MLTHCSSTAESISEILLAGDVVLNLSGQPLQTLAGTRFLVDGPHGPLLSDQDGTAVGRASWNSLHLRSVAGFRDSRVSRIVVVSEENCSMAESVAESLAGQNQPYLMCTLMKSCDADAFMDEDDAEAVTERLRQLGYL